MWYNIYSDTQVKELSGTFASSGCTEVAVIWCLAAPAGVKPVVLFIGSYLSAILAADTISVALLGTHMWSELT